MARSDPARSDYCATRHLLRNLYDERQLRRNPLARDAFAVQKGDDALRTIADRVYRALGAMDAQQVSDRRWQGTRHPAILLRVDAGRHDPRLVATDLGLSSRQFHRERRLAHDRFVEAYRAITPRMVATVEGDFATRLLERAGALADSGETSSAIAILDDVAGNADDAARCAALVRLAEIEAWAHRLERVRTHLRAAHSLLEAASMSADRRIRLQDAADAVSLSLQWFEHGPDAVERTVATERSDERSDDGIRGDGRETLVRAAAALRRGESSSAARLLRRVEAITTAERNPDIAVDVFTLQAELADFTAEDPLHSERLFARAAAIAHQHGLGGRELYAKHQLYSTRWMHSRNRADRNAYRHLVDCTNRSLPPRLRSYLLFSAADIEVAIGQPGRALSLAQAAGAVSTNAYERFSALGLAAGALLRLGRIADAGAHAALAAEAARAEGHARIVSLAQRISAQAHLAQGQRRAARVAIEESIECARRFSSAHVLAQAHAVLGQITGRT
jgi:hypothetical protein